MSVVRPNLATHEPHSHAEDEGFFILVGRAEFSLNGEKVVVEKNTSLYCPPNVAHNLRNIGDSDLKYIVIKKYEKK
ncbi:MAG TPA: cupin domain-containing protein [bacterium]